jgi:hypothetical protein
MAVDELELSGLLEELSSTDIEGRWGWSGRDGGRRRDGAVR